ncbi:hypothetical protein CFC21_021476, partial [Triticum aestivum]
MASPKKARKPRARRPCCSVGPCCTPPSASSSASSPASPRPPAGPASASAHVSRALHAVDGAFDRAVLLLRQQQRQLRDGRVHVAVLPSPAPGPPALEPLRQPQLLLVVTATERSDPERRAAGLTRAAHALRLVPPPVLWLVVERATEALPTSRLLRGAGVAYRHLTYPENFTADGVGVEKERHHQRNLALEHVEEHRLGRCRALRRPRRRLRPPLLRPAQADQDVRRVAGGDRVGARAEGDGGRPGVRRLAVGSHRLVLHGRRRGCADGEGETAGRHGGRGALRVRQRPALAPEPLGQLPRLRARRLT